MIFSERLHELRTKKGMTEEELASLLEVPTELISKWEMGTAIPEMEFVKKLEGIFSVTSLDFLVDREDMMRIREHEEKIISGEEIGAKKQTNNSNEPITTDTKRTVTRIITIVIFALLLPYIYNFISTFLEMITKK